MTNGRGLRWILKPSLIQSCIWRNDDLGANQRKFAQIIPGFTTYLSDLFIPFQWRQKATYFYGDNLQTKSYYKNKV